VSTEAIQEFRVITSNPDATFGRSSGAQVNVVTKSGTNDLRGSVYGYFREDRFDSPDYFSTSSSALPFRQGLFGATAGGPGIDATLPLAPEFARVLGVEVVLDVEAHRAGELLRAVADEQMMVRAVHHRLGDQ
jgi:hypothetical protein